MALKLLCFEPRDSFDMICIGEFSDGNIISRFVTSGVEK